MKYKFHKTFLEILRGKCLLDLRSRATLFLSSVRHFETHGANIVFVQLCFTNSHFSKKLF